MTEQGRKYVTKLRGPILQQDTVPIAVPQDFALDINAMNQVRMAPGDVNHLLELIREHYPRFGPFQVPLPADYDMDSSSDEDSVAAWNQWNHRHDGYEEFGDEEFSEEDEEDASDAFGNSDDDEESLESDWSSEALESDSEPADEDSDDSDD